MDRREFLKKTFIGAAITSVAVEIVRSGESSKEIPEDAKQTPKAKDKKEYSETDKYWVRVNQEIELKPVQIRHFKDGSQIIAFLVADRTIDVMTLELMSKKGWRIAEKYVTHMELAAGDVLEVTFNFNERIPGQAV